MKLNYIDIHSHLNLSPLSENQEAILVKMREMKVGTITVGTGMETSKRAIEIAEQNPELCWATVGFHPCDGHVPSGESDWIELAELARHEKVVAIGETGLDYFRDASTETKQKQVEILKKHIALAIEVNKPLMLHVRASKGTDDAYYDALEILKEYNQSLLESVSSSSQIPSQSSASSFHSSSSNSEKDSKSVKKQLRANFHFFSGSKQCMIDITTAGYSVSVDGPITFSDEYDDMITACPITQLMIETDAPYAAPKPYRGKPCEPWMVGEVAQRIAELKGVDQETVRIQLLENAKTFFALSPDIKILDK
jgi:TatD DNase family protein